MNADEQATADSLNSAPVGLAVLRLGLPLAIGMASHALVNLVDLALIGRLGEDAVAAAHIATTINFLPMIVGNSISIAAIALLSQRVGAGEQALATAFARRSLWYMFWLGLVVSVATAAPAGPFVDTVGLEGAVRQSAVEYLVICNLGCLPMFLLMQTTAVMRAAGEAAVPLVLLLVTNVLNLLLDIVLLFGWPALGIPSLGVLGAAYATVVARIVAVLAAFWWLRRPGHPMGLGRPRTVTGSVVTGRVQQARVAVAGVLWRGAWPQVAQIGLRAALVWWVTVIVQRNLGNAGSTALGITTRLDTVVLFSAIGFANAATTIAGRAVARGEWQRARRAGLWAGLQALLFGALLLFAFRAGGSPMLRLFLPDAGDAVVAAGLLYLSVAALAQPFAACALGAMGAVYGGSRMVPPLLVDLVAFAGLALVLIEVQGRGLSVVYHVLVWGAVVLALMQLGLVTLWPWRKPLAVGSTR